MEWDLNQNNILKAMRVRHKETEYQSILCITKCPEVLCDETVKKHLNDKEYSNYKSLRHDRRRKSYYLGRHCSRLAINMYIGYEDQNITIENGVFNQPIIKGCYEKGIQVSITHSGDLGGAIVFDENLIMGLDIEQIDSEHKEVIENQLTEQEKDLINTFGEYMVGLTAIWTAKESLSKALKTGMMTPFSLFEIEKIKREEDQYLCYYKNFTQYKSRVFTINAYACSITYPAHTDILLE